MIISRTPLRLSLVGGGTDLASFYERAGIPGAVVSFTIDRFIYIAVNPKFDDKIRVSYSQTEIVESPQDLHHDLVREALKFTDIQSGIEIVSIADIPGEGSGLGSSSSFLVGLLNALNQYRIAYLGAEAEKLALDLAEQAAMIEIERCFRPIGKQDHYAAAYGGLNYFEFSKDGVKVERISTEPEFIHQLESSLLLFWTGRTRPSGVILAEQSQNFKTSDKRLANGINMAIEAAALRDDFKRGDMMSLGNRLHENWERKKELASGISNPEIDEWYNTAREAGALGGKIAGAGGGGFLMVVVPPDKAHRVENALPLRRVPFKFCPTGSSIAYMKGFNDG